MKNTLLLLSFLALVSCSQSSEKKATETIHTENNFQLVEINPEQVSKIVAPKQNDTIYVTNFFATWCGPCMHEIPFFKEKMDELKNEKIKFTFVSIDNPKDWNNAVHNFAQETGLAKNIVLFNTQHITPDFFSKNFKYWDGATIPFTIITKGNKIDETVGMMRKYELTEKINAFK